MTCLTFSSNTFELCNVGVISHVSGYKKHTDCTEDTGELRDRMATVLVYLDDVETGGETDFPGKSNKFISFQFSIMILARLNNGILAS